MKIFMLLEGVPVKRLHRRITHSLDIVASMAIQSSTIKHGYVLRNLEIARRRDSRRRAFSREIMPTLRERHLRWTPIRAVRRDRRSWRPRIRARPSRAAPTGTRDCAAILPPSLPKLHWDTRSTG